MNLRRDSIFFLVNNPSKYFQFIIFSGLVFISLSCTRPSTKCGNAFRMSLGSEPPTLDWNLATDSVSFRVITQIMEGLARYDDRLNPSPAVAERWEVSRDGKTYTYYLHKNVLWSDGRPVMAQDFLYSWRRLLDPKTGAEYAYFLYDIIGAEEFNAGKVRDFSAVGVEVPSPDIIRIRLKKPAVYFPYVMTFMVTFPLRQDMVEKYGDRWTEPGNIMTNGPYLLATWRHDYRIVLRKNPRYYGKPPEYPEVKMFVVPEPNTALTLYETSDLDMTPLSSVAIPRYMTHSDYRRVAQLRGYYYGFNTRKKPFDDVRVRQAFSLAIDRAELPRILKGGEVPATSWVPEGMFGYNPTIGLGFDPKRAQSLLARAGYPGGKGLPRVTAAFNSESYENKLVGENLQAQWRKNLGVNVDLDSQEWKVYLRALKTDPPQIFRLGWGADFPDPDNFLEIFTTHSGNNHTRWGSRRFDSLIAKAAGEQDRRKRLRMYDEAQAILTEKDVPMISLFFSAQNVLVKPCAKGVTLNPMDIMYLKDAFPNVIPSPLEGEGGGEGD